MSNNAIDAKDAGDASLEWRTWTSADGRKAQVAAFMACDGGIVQVVTRGGQTAQLPLAKLSDADRQYVAGKETFAADLFEAGEPGQASPAQSASGRDPAASPKPSSAQAAIPWYVLVLNPVVLYALYRLTLIARGKVALPSFRDVAIMLVLVLAITGPIFAMLRIWTRFFPDPGSAPQGRKLGLEFARLCFVAVPIALLLTVAVVVFSSFFAPP